MNKQGANIPELEFLLFKAGDERQFEKIFKSKYNRIVGYCNQFIFDLDKSKSIAQESFIKLWVNREKVETENGISSFLYTAAKSGCLNYLRHENIKSKYVNSSIQEKEYKLSCEILESFQFGSIEYSELEEAINKAIQELPERCRLVFVKSRFEGKKNGEIADDLGIALKSVETNMTRAFKYLRKRLSEFITILFVIFFGA